MCRAEGDAREGAALAVVLLLLLAILALAQGTLSLAHLELTASRADRRLLEARAAAAAGRAAALSAPIRRTVADVALWGRVRLATGTLEQGNTYVTTLTRLSREAWLLRSTGRAAQGPASVRRAHTVWVLDALGRIEAMHGVLQVGEGTPLRVDGRIDGGGMTEEDAPLVPGACASWYAAFDSIMPSGRLPGVQSLGADTSGAEPKLGRLRRQDLLSLITARVGGVGTPRPVERLGSCDTVAVWNWGNPEQPSAACGAHFVTVASDGDLTVEGGEGQGILVVGGDLTLTASARFYGVLLVGGALRLDDGAEIVGMVRAAGGAYVASGTWIRGSACWAALALKAATGVLDRPEPVGGTEWIGPLGAEE